MIHPVVLPHDSSFRRSLRTTRINRGAETFTEADLSQYDYHTLFYDVFLAPGNDRLCLVGPPLLNLARKLTPVTVTVNGHEKRLKWREHFRRRITIAGVGLDGVEVGENNEVSLSFNGLFAWRDSIPVNNAPEGGGILAAIQKNSRIDWILDWCRYYRRRFAIDKIIIYDNGSDNRDELITAVTELPYVKIEPWDFPYGIHRSHGNKFCQAGALNQCRLKHGNNSILFNFDIDELLVYSREKLMTRLKHGKIVKFGHYMVPVVDTLPGDYSFRYFNRRVLPAKTEFQKYVCRSEDILVSHVHTAQHKPVNLVTDFDKIIYKIVDLAVKIPGLPRGILNRLPYQEIPVEEGFFLHYRGINTGWKSGAKKFRIREDEEHEDYSPFEE